MSATGRNRDGHERDGRDWYATPAWAVGALLDALPGWVPTLEPCAGDGAIVAAVRERHAPGPAGVERDPELVARAREVRGLDLCEGDGLARPWHGEHVIMNPPYGTALGWTTKAADEAASACVLLRLNYLGSQQRAPWWRTHPPRFVGVLSKRPSFRHGRTDATEYAWYGWGALPGDLPLFGRAALAWLLPPATGAAAA